MGLASCRRGAVALEFALGFPVFMAMTYGLFEFSRVYFVKNTVQFAIEEAARVAMVDSGSTEADVQTLASARATGLDAADLSIDATFEDVAGTRAFVNITGTYSFAPILPLVIPFVASDSSVDFQILDFDIISSIRMPVVQ